MSAIPKLYENLACKEKKLYERVIPYGLEVMSLISTKHDSWGGNSPKYYSLCPF